MDKSATEATIALPRIAILAVPEVTASVAYGMYDLFMSAGRDWPLMSDGKPGATLLRPVIVAAQMEPFRAANAVYIHPDTTLAACEAPEVVCVPELFVAPAEDITGRFLPEIEWLRRCHAAGAIIATACSGAVLLAETGLLDGYEATTHWAYCDPLHKRHPGIRVRERSALVVSGEGQRLVMAGGGTSWLDLALYLVARTVGVDEAMRVARVSLIDWHDIGQQPFARLARSRQVDDAAIGRCQVWIAEHYQEPAPVAAMARLSGIAERSFKRRFKQATGMSPLEYVHIVRLEEAKQMLEATHEPIEAIANEVGYEDAGFFSRLFKRKVSLSPAQYRKRFGSLRRALEQGARPPL